MCLHILMILHIFSNIMIRDIYNKKYKQNRISVGNTEKLSKDNILNLKVMN